MRRFRTLLLSLLLPLALLTSGTALSQAHAHLGLSPEEPVFCRPLSLITREEYLTGGHTHTLPPLEDGDILLTFSTHSFGWRHGHAGLVVDAEAGLVLEAVVLGRPSQILQVDHWQYYSTLLVLRPRDREAAQGAVEYALAHLTNLPYRLTSGLWGSRELAGELAGAQCAYLVWLAYYTQGLDLDGDGGRLVTVGDLAQSPELEQVACLGINGHM